MFSAHMVRNTDVPCCRLSQGPPCLLSAWKMKNSPQVRKSTLAAAFLASSGLKTHPSGSLSLLTLPKGDRSGEPRRQTAAFSPHVLLTAAGPSELTSLSSVFASVEWGHSNGCSVGVSGRQTKGKEGSAGPPAWARGRRGLRSLPLSGIVVFTAVTGPDLCFTCLPPECTRL